MRRTPHVVRIFGLLLFVGAAATVAGGCDIGGGTEIEGLSPPTVQDAIGDQSANAGGDAITVSLGPVFTNPNGAPLSYSASSSDSSVATTRLSDSTLTVTPGQGGEADIMVIARNDAGEATEMFVVNVFADPPDRPE